MDAPRLGAAYDDLVLNPDAWRAFGTASEIRTCFRRLWHVLVLRGGPADSRTGSSDG